MSLAELERQLHASLTIVTWSAGSRERYATLFLKKQACPLRFELS